MPHELKALLLKELIRATSTAGGGNPPDGLCALSLDPSPLHSTVNRGLRQRPHIIEKVAKLPGLLPSRRIAVSAVGQDTHPVTLALQQRLPRVTTQYGGVV